MFTEPITCAQWIAATTVAGVLWGNKSRSQLLQRVDQALLAYEESLPRSLARLHQVFDAYNSWYASKPIDSETREANSIRNRNGILKAFENCLMAEERRLNPQPEAGWDFGPNCYAYAMKCKLPTGHGMAPGIAAQKPASMNNLDQGLASYAARLFEGILADAQADKKIIQVIRPTSGTFTCFPEVPDPIPMEPTGHYLVAMLVTPHGFHFMRRDPITRLWSHKNRADGSVENTITRFVPNRRLSYQVPITDALAIQLLKNQPSHEYEMIGGNYRFAGYLAVPDSGILVRGIQHS